MEELRNFVLFLTSKHTTCAMFFHGEPCQTAGNQMGGPRLGKAPLCCRRCAPSSVVKSDITGLLCTKLVGGNCFQALARGCPQERGTGRMSHLNASKEARPGKKGEGLHSHQSGFALISAGWLDDIGLPQYKDQFHESRVDGRMLQYLTVVSTVFFPQFYQL